MFCTDRSGERTASSGTRPMADRSESSVAQRASDHRSAPRPCVTSLATRRQRRQRGCRCRRTDHRQGLPARTDRLISPRHGAVSHISEGHPLELSDAEPPATAAGAVEAGVGRLSVKFECYPHRTGARLLGNGRIPRQIACRPRQQCQAGPEATRLPTVMLRGHPSADEAALKNR